MASTCMMAAMVGLAMLNKGKAPVKINHTANNNLPLSCAHSFVKKLMSHLLFLFQTYPRFLQIAIAPLFLAAITKDNPNSLCRKVGDG